MVIHVTPKTRNIQRIFFKKWECTIGLTDGLKRFNAETIHTAPNANDRINWVSEGLRCDRLKMIDIDTLEKNRMEPSKINATRLGMWPRR